MTRIRLHPAHWPLALRVPLLVAALVVAAAVVLSQSVLDRLARDQERHLADLASTYLDGLSNALMPAAIRGDVFEAFDALDRARRRSHALRPLQALVALPDGTVLAAVDPRALPVGAKVPDGLAVPGAAAIASGKPVLDAARARAVLGRDLVEGDVFVGRILAEVDIAPLLADRLAVRRTLLLVNGGLAIGLACIGFGLVRRLLRPLELLRDHVAGGADGPVAPVDERVFAGFSDEVRALFAAWNRTAAAVAERQTLAARLADEEKYALLGKLASGMAHEVNNPLAGMITAVDTLAKHGADAGVRTVSIDLLHRGLADIRDVVRAGLVTYKGRVGEGPLRREDLDDLRHLVRHEIVRRDLVLDWTNALPDSVAVDRTIARQIALNLLLNAASVTDVGGRFRFTATATASGLGFEVADEGPGLPAMAQALLDDPQAPPPVGGGLGLWTAVRLADRLGGRIRRLPSGLGTRLAVHLPADEAVRAPLHVA